MTLAAATALAASGEILFQEDFSHYRDSAPGAAQGEGVYIGNDPIYSHQSEIGFDVAEDTDVFLAGKPLPAGNAFDVLFRFNLAKTNCAFAVNFAGADGKAVSVPVQGFAGGWRDAALKADGKRLTLYVARTNCFCAVSSTDLAGELKSVNFRVKAGGRVALTRVVVRTPAPLAESPALAQFPAASVLGRTLDDVPGEGGVRVSDGTPLDLAKFGCSFVPGTTGVVGSLDVTWDSGVVSRYPIAVDAERYRSQVPRIGIKQLGLKPMEDWIGPDAVIDFGEKGRLARLFVRPYLRSYANFTQVSDRGMDVVRDWALLPPASRHVTTVEMRPGARGLSELWLDGSYVTQVKPARNDKQSTCVVRAELVLAKGVAHKVRPATPVAADGTLVLPIWANPKAKSFADAKAKAPIPGAVAPCASSDIGLVAYQPCGYSLESDSYTMRTPLDGYPGEVHFRVPAGPYVAAELLFCLDDDPKKVPYAKARIACYSDGCGVGCTELQEQVIDLRGGLPAGTREVGRIVRGGREYPVYRTEIELPLGRQIDLATGPFVDLEFVGPTQENLQQTDFSKLPRDDVRSSLTLLGVTLRQLNVLPELVQSTPGNVFTEDERVKTTAVRLTALVDGAKGEIRFGDEVRPYAFAKAGDVVTNVFDFSKMSVGLRKVPLAIDDGKSVLRHEVVVCVTPEARRLATIEESPYGTWWFNAHGSPGEADVGGPFLQKAGIRKSTLMQSAEARAKYGFTFSGFIYAPKMSLFNEKTGRFKGDKTYTNGEERVVAEMKAARAKRPFVDHIMVWHESAPGCGGLPEEILGLAAPTNDTARERRFAAYVNEVGRICRKHFPDLKIQFGNSTTGLGALAVPLRGGAKAEYYDSVGIEIPAQTIPPERVCDAGLLGMNITKAVGRKLAGRDIPAAGCYEFVYRTVRDLGARGEDVQAEFYTRDIIISLMNGFRLVAPGLLFDCKRAYCKSMWGVSGIVGRAPQVYPKKAYLAYAVATKVLDGVTFVREIPTGSATVYAAEFRRKDGRYATAFWCVRGEADIACAAAGEVWTMDGVRTAASGDARFTCSGAPVYVVSEKPCDSVSIAARRFPEDAARAAAGKPLADFSLANVVVAPDPEMESQHHGFVPYLKPGAFVAKDVVDPEEGACLELTLDTTAKTAYPLTEFVTEYTTVRFRESVPVPGVSGLLGVRVKGDSGWGQLRFEIEDAEGEVFKGLTTGRSWGCDIYDWPGYMALSFDGWSDVCQRTDANDYDLILTPGPSDEQWVSSTGGDKRITWPVRIRAVTVCVNRCKPTLLGFAPPAPTSVRLKRVWSAPAKADPLARRRASDGR